MLQYLKNRLNEYSAGYFINDLADASKYLGILEAKISTYKFNSILIPMLHKKEALSSMYIEGTQTTISDVLENEINPKAENEKIAIEINNHTRALLHGADHLRVEGFTHTFIQKIHELMMNGLLPEEHVSTLGKYKKYDNRIINSVGTVIFTPPPASETKKYMDELIAFMNDTDDNIHPLVKAALIHSQFESIHPFSDGNGRVGRILVSLYLFKAKVINFPFFYISEAISQDKTVYYNMLTNSRTSNYDEWIRYFLRKIVIQTKKHIGYIDDLDDLYTKTKKTVQKNINSPKFDDIITYLFTHPVLNGEKLADALSVSNGQAMRYINVLETEHILLGNDKKRNRTFYFAELIELARGI
ncbi:MAG: Fic family protein [Clostridia bacterium]|nr:Fic family protein [Clostridia bacterium]